MISIVLAALLASVFQSPPAQSELRIVVLEGEDAVNVIQQKTAVRPLIEVRDRNNLPVAGATVTFTIGGGSPAAFAGGLQTLTVTTNAAGQAAAGGFGVLGPGSVQIQVQAAFQGQVAAAAITQTNVATAAAAAQAGAGAGSGSGAGGGAAAGGGGLSTGATIGIVGGAVAAGGIAVGAAQLRGGEDGKDGGESFDPYQGTFSGQLVFTNARTGGSCSVTRALTGSLKIDLRTDLSGGAVDLMGTATMVATTGCTDTPVLTFAVVDTQASGGPSALTFASTRTSTSATTENTNRVSFTGTHSGNTITGSLTIEFSTRYIDAFPGTGIGSTTVPITLVRTAGR